MLRQWSGACCRGAPGVRVLTCADRDEAGRVGQGGRYSAHFLSGFVSGGVAAAVTNPLDVIKTRLQVQDYYSKGAGARPRYTTVRAMAKGLVRDEGWAALGKGVVVRLLPLPFSPTLSHSHSLSRSHTLTHTLSHTLSHTRSHTLSR